MLDPLNDLVERFSDLMLMASVAFGVQLLLLEMGVHWGMSLALTLVALAWAWLYLKRKQSPALLARVLVALLLVRFIVPAAGMTSDVIYRGFMQEQYAAGQQGIEQASQAIGALAPAPADSAADKRWWQLDKHIKQLGDTIDKTVEHAIRLIVVFLLQTLILPLAVFWILLRSGRMLTAAGVEVTRDPEGAEVTVETDFDRVAQVLIILISNAVKYGRSAAPEITITLTETPEAAHLDVADRGPGIAPDKREEVFQKFARLGEANLAGSAGLGLPIAREIMRNLGGDLRVMPNAPGAVFRVILPKRAARAKAAE